MGDAAITPSAEAASAPSADGRFPLWALGCFLFVALAVVFEMIGGSFANSPVPAWADDFAPIAWPQPARVVWWFLVAAAAAGYRVGERRAGIRRNPIVIAASVLPFAVFGLGILTSADWATWH